MNPIKKKKSQKAYTTPDLSVVIRNLFRICEESDVDPALLVEGLCVVAHKVAYVNQMDPDRFSEILMNVHDFHEEFYRDQDFKSSPVDYHSKN